MPRVDEGFEFDKATPHRSQISNDDHLGHHRAVNDNMICSGFTSLIRRFEPMLLIEKCKFRRMIR